MNYEQWSEQYLAQAETLRMKIETLQKEMSQLASNQREAAQYRIRILYQIYLELRHTGLYLKKYGRHIK